jgi:outer membrane protein assembly factor BamB
MIRRQLWLMSLACWLGCAGTRPGPTTPVIIAGSVCSDLPNIKPIEHASAGPLEPALVAALSEGTTHELALYDVQAARLRFRAALTLHSRPQILHDVLVATDEQGRLLGLDLESGARRFSVNVEREHWLGAVQVGQLVIFTSSSLSFRPGERGSSVTAIDARSGALVWQRSVPYALSRPTAIDERVFLISDHADVWEIDARSGSPTGCARSTSEPVEWLDGHGAELWFGANQARVMDPLATNAAKLSLSIADLPGRPALRASDYDAVPASRSAHGRIGLVDAFEQRNGTAQLVGDRYYFVFYRHLFAYRSDGALLWARLLDADSVRLQLAGQLLLLVGEDGSLQLLAADSGAERGRVQLAASISSADIRPAPLAAAATATEPARPLRNALAEIAFDTDTRLLPGRLLAVSALGAQADPAASSDLLHIYAQSGAPAPLRERIAKVLASRKLGSEYLFDALLEHYDFLEDRSPPPLAAIVPGLVAAHETRAVPRLVDRLFDPETRLDELTELVEAIAQLGDQSASYALAKFLAMYHADSSLAADPTSLVAAARALLKRNDSHVALVQQLAQAPITLPGLRTSLAELLSAPEAPAAPAVAVAPAGIAAAAVPGTLADADVKQAMAEHADDLRTCILSELARNPSMRQLRLSFVVKNDGSFEGLQVLPDHAQLQACLKLRLTALRFPRFERGRRLASYTVAVHSDAVSAALAQPTASERPFWKVAELRAGPWPHVPSVAPWWENQNPLFVAVDDTLTPGSTSTTGATLAPPVAPAPGATQPASKPAASDAAPPTAPAAVDQWWLPAGAR